jgi:hypothetical protein
MMKRTLLAFLCVLFACSAARAQTPAPAAPPQMLRVFLDCHECDDEYLKTEITFVDYVRDRESADVHILVTTQGTGGGGTSWTFKFIGLKGFQDQGLTLSMNTASTATSDDRRKEVARVLKLGLVGYAAGTSVVPRLNVSYTKPAADAAAANASVKDPWNYWVFSLSANGNMNGEEASSNRSYRFSFSGNRTTEMWKISFSGNRNENRSEYDIGEPERFKSTSSSWGSSSLVVKSLGPRWSLGSSQSANGSTFSNQDFQFNFAPGVEFNVFPYKESTRRSLTFIYKLGLNYYNYKDVTIFDKLTETVPYHSIGTSLGLRQPWGSVNASINWSQHLNKLDRTNLGVFGSTDVRLFKGFSFNVFGDYSRIRDQIGLKKNNASTEDVLLRLRQLASGYSYFVGFGVSYRFGSIFNNVVNPRFGGGGGGMMFFF